MEEQGSQFIRWLGKEADPAARFIDLKSSNLFQVMKSSPCSDGESLWSVAFISIEVQIYCNNLKPDLQANDSAICFFADWYPYSF